MDLTTIVGVGASVFTSSALIPQVVKLLKEKKSEDVSILMLTVLLLGLGLWVYYGILKSDLIIIVSNVFAACVNILTFVLTIYFRKK
jgi:MtN3 and saliva related transmembrane protein